MAEAVLQIVFVPAEDGDAICHGGDAHQRKLEQRRGGIDLALKRSSLASKLASSLTCHSRINHWQQPVRIA
jgi:hypothetical protein